MDFDTLPARFEDSLETSSASPAGDWAAAVAPAPWAAPVIAPVTARRSNGYGIPRSRAGAVFGRRAIDLAGETIELKMPDPGRVSGTGRITILVVDDDAVDVRAIKRSFWQQKITNPIVVAGDGIEALDILRGDNGQEKIASPFVVLLDLNMPRMGGVEFLEELRADPDLRRTLVFVLTTSADLDDRDKAYNEERRGLCTEAPLGRKLRGSDPHAEELLADNRLPGLTPSIILPDWSPVRSPASRIVPMGGACEPARTGNSPEQTMTLIHHVVTGAGDPPIVFVHGFACAHEDWDAQVAHLSPRHRTVAVDLRGHGASPGTAADCSIERTAPTWLRSCARWRCRKR